MPYLSSGDAAKFGESLNLGVFLKVDLADVDGGPIRLWLGVHDLMHRFTVEVSDHVYTGGGRLTTVPEFDVIINGGAERIDITMEGVTAEAAAAIDMANPQVVGREVLIGMAAFNRHWEIDTDIFPLNRFVADYWAMSGTEVRGAEAQTRVLRLSCAAGETARSRPRRVTYSDAQQKFRFPTDDFCKNVARYDRGFSLGWPRF